MSGLDGDDTGIEKPKGMRKAKGRKGFTGFQPGDSSLRGTKSPRSWSTCPPFPFASRLGDSSITMIATATSIATATPSGCRWVSYVAFCVYAYELNLLIRPRQVVLLFLVRVFLQYTSGRAGFIIMPLLLYNPRNVTMVTAAAPSCNIILDHWWGIQK